MDLYKEEYETLRKEVETAMSELNTLESAALVATAAIFTWLLTHRVEGPVGVAWLLPFVLVLFCALRALAIDRHLRWLGQYLKQHESAFMQSQPRGWEHFLDGRPEGKTRPRRGFRGAVAYVFWGFLILVSFGAGVVGCRTTPAASATASCATGA